MSAKVNSDLLLIGKITGVHGLRGDLVVFSYTNPVNNLLEYANLTLNNDLVTINTKIKSGYVQKNRLIIKLHNIDNRSDAEKLHGYQIYIGYEQLPKLPQDEYYWHELIGLQVINTENQFLGKVDNLLATGANDVLIVKPCLGSFDEKERLLPYTKNCVLNVDIANKTITVEWDADF